MPSPPQLELYRGDISQLAVDAIVNAANRSLLAACRKLNGCNTGDAKATAGFHLPARFIFHAIGPVWHGGTQNEEVSLASCYTRCLELATEHNIQSIAFPAISTGVYGFPKQRAAEIAVATIRTQGPTTPLTRILFCAFDDATAEIYTPLLSQTPLE